MVPINPSPRTPLYEMVSEALGGKDVIQTGQLLLIFGGYNTIGEEFGVNSTFVRPCLTLLVHSPVLKTLPDARTEHETAPHDRWSGSV